MKLSIQHTTSYRFDTPAFYGLQQLRLTPKDHNGQTIADWRMEVEGGKIETSFVDHHSNRVTLVSLDPQATEVTITCKGDVETEDTAGVIGKHGGFAPLWYFKRSTDLTRAGQKVRSLIKGLRDEHAEDHEQQRQAGADPQLLGVVRVEQPLELVRVPPCAALEGEQEQRDARDD